jgi:hypothetical protein
VLFEKDLNAVAGTFPDGIVRREARPIRITIGIVIFIPKAINNRPAHLFTSIHQELNRSHHIVSPFANSMTSTAGPESGRPLGGTSAAGDGADLSPEYMSYLLEHSKRQVRQNRQKKLTKSHKWSWTSPLDLARAESRDDQLVKAMNAATAERVGRQCQLKTVDL